MRSTSWAASSSQCAPKSIKLRRDKLSPLCLCIHFRLTASDLTRSRPLAPSASVNPIIREIAWILDISSSSSTNDNAAQCQSPQYAHILDACRPNEIINKAKSLSCLALKQTQGLRVGQSPPANPSARDPPSTGPFDRHHDPDAGSLALLLSEEALQCSNNSQDFTWLEWIGLHAV